MLLQSININQTSWIEKSVGKGSGAEAPIFALHQMLTAIGREELLHHLSLDFVVKFRQNQSVYLCWISCWIVALMVKVIF